MRELAEEAGVASWTIDRALIDLDRYDDPFTPRTVVILDEAGMAATRSTERVLAAAQKAGAKVIAIGDSGQLRPCRRAAGCAPSASASARTSSPRSCANATATSAARSAELHAGQPAAYLLWAQDRDRLQVHTDSSAHAAALVDWHGAVDEHGVQRAVLIARSQDSRAALNAAAARTAASRARSGPTGSTARSRSRSAIG